MHTTQSTPNWQHLTDLFEATCTPRLTTISGRVTCEPSWRWDITLSDYDLWFAVHGSGQIWINNQHHTVQPGTLIFLRPQDHVYATQNPNNCLTVIYLHLDFFQPGTKSLASLPTHLLPARYRVLPNPAPLDALLTRCVKLRSQTPWLPLAQLEANSLLLQALLELYRQDATLHGNLPTQPDTRIQLLIDHIKSHPTQRLSLEDAAHIAGLSPKYLSTCFTQQIGVSLRSFQVHTRLERSQHLLTETTLTINEIAHMLGYDNPFLFCRQFKQLYGYPPSQLRK